jgi:60 kDa SS-A/Ro ribonucleoprotein
MTAMIRNLGKMTSLGLLDSMSDGARLVTEKLTNVDLLHKARVHPLSALVALSTYKRGSGVRGSLVWVPNQDIVDALDEAFYLAFQCIEPTGKNFLLGIDVSGSMTWGEIAGMPGISPNVAAAAMAMVTARTEKNRQVMGFCNQFVDLGITPRQRLDEVMRRTTNRSFGATDCAVPMHWALDNKVHNIDAFVVYTDNETWAGRRGHPSQALQQYRQRTGRNAKLIVVGMTATEFTIADPNDAGMMDVVGFDTAAPNIMADFVRGE